MEYMSWHSPVPLTAQDKLLCDTSTPSPTTWTAAEERLFAVQEDTCVSHHNLYNRGRPPPCSYTAEERYSPHQKSIFKAD